MTPPLENIRFMALVWAATAVLAFLLGGSHLLDGPSDMEAEAATAASLRDALAQAQRERPDLWTAEQKARADVAARLAAQGVQP